MRRRPTLRLRPDPHLVSKVVEILKHGNPDSQAVVLPLLAALPSDSPWTTQPEVIGGLRALLEQQPRPANYAQVLNAASSFKTPDAGDRAAATGAGRAE